LYGPVWRREEPFRAAEARRSGAYFLYVSIRRLRRRRRMCRMKKLVMVPRP